MGAARIIFDTVTGLFDALFERVRAVVMAAFAQFVAFMRKRQYICGDAMANGMCSHFYFLLQLYACLSARTGPLACLVSEHCCTVCLQASLPGGTRGAVPLAVFQAMLSIKQIIGVFSPRCNHSRLLRARPLPVADIPGELPAGMRTAPWAALIAQGQSVAAWIGGAGKKLVFRVNRDGLSVAYRALPGSQHSYMVAEPS